MFEACYVVFLDDNKVTEALSNCFFFFFLIKEKELPTQEVEQSWLAD